MAVCLILVADLVALPLQWLSTPCHPRPACFRTWRNPRIFGYHLEPWFWLLLLLLQVVCDPEVMESYQEDLFVENWQLILSNTNPSLFLKGWRPARSYISFFPAERPVIFYRYVGCLPKSFSRSDLLSSIPRWVSLGQPADLTNQIICFW